MSLPKYSFQKCCFVFGSRILVSWHDTNDNWILIRKLHSLYSATVGVMWGRREAEAINDTEESSMKFKVWILRRVRRNDILLFLIFGS